VPGLAVSIAAALVLAAQAAAVPQQALELVLAAQAAGA